MAAGAEVPRLSRSQCRGILAGAAFRHGRPGVGQRQGAEEESDDEFADDFADEPEEEPDEEDNLFGTAYEDVTYRDSTDDGVEGEIFETGESTTDFELVGEAERMVKPA